MKISPSLKNRLKKIKMIVTDVDGVLTDGGIFLSDNKEETKRFNAKDGSMTELAQQSGISVVLVTGRKCEATKRRAQEMSAEVFFKHDMARQKKSFLQIVKQKYHVTPDQILYMGDDIGDIAMMRKTGVSAAPADAHSLVKDVVDIVASKPGGQGVLGEIVEILLKGQGAWDKMTERFRKVQSSDFDAKI